MQIVCSHHLLAISSKDSTMGLKDILNPLLHSLNGSTQAHHLFLNLPSSPGYLLAILMAEFQAGIKMLDISPSIV
jgi:hypothetical protein